MRVMQIIVEEWTPDHPRWSALVALIADAHQTAWAFDPRFAPFPRTFVVALADDQVVGFLMFVVWDIGPHDRGLPPLLCHGQPLTEAKIIAFGVHVAYRRQGIGRTLQAHAIRRATALGCYQVRSVSGSHHAENHQLKLAMGFGVEPMERDAPAWAFILPLR